MEAKTVHFSDWPVPKVRLPTHLLSTQKDILKFTLLTDTVQPWVNFPSNALDEHKPPCHWNATSGEEDDYRDRDVWLGMYYDFNTRRMIQSVCGDLK
ncbi:hypothetical protein N7494_013305 [Penicillium frequentans]|uniref:Uncharacterized protein n=1 Tax=Penicillium frequentans TaxID=3151616 RepID=A0AAD6CJP9_9EURO|nr:hypothetical protein N7494_013305 [Penicillium glabrum]